MKYTENYTLNLPEDSDYALIEVLNENAQTIDRALKAIVNALQAHNAAHDSHQYLLQLIAGIYTSEETDDQIDAKIAAHNIAEAAHPNIRVTLAALDARIKMLEDFLYNDITGNPHSITFASLEGLIVTGVWNEALARLEC